MADKKPKKKPTITPAGVASNCWLDKPDVKFKDKGEFHTNLTLSAEAAAPFVKKADEMMETLRASDEVAELEKKRVEWNKNPKNKKKQIEELQENLPYAPDVNDAGEETGDVIFKFATAASGVSKKTNKPWTKKLDVFDAKRKPVKGSVWAGSTIKVAFTESAWTGTVQSGYGVKFYLEAVQVLELVQGGQRNAAGYGFGEEDGYEGEDETADEAAPADTAETSNEGGEGGDATDF